jgi:hypothetical protein
MSTLIKGDAAANTNESGNTQVTDANNAAQTDATQNNAAATTEANADGKAVDAKAEKAVGAPEKYVDFKMPEGFQMEAEILEKFMPIAKELNLTQDAAQKVIDLATEHVKILESKQVDSFMKVREGWVESIKSDKDFGGAKFGETIERAKRALTKFGSREFATLLDDSGYGDNPELIRFLAKVDKAIGEDKTVDGLPSTASSKSAAQVLYGV